MTIEGGYVHESRHTSSLRRVRECQSVSQAQGVQIGVDLARCSGHVRWRGGIGTN